jgi:peptidoglycan/LPS O-acetylase OafA/YrhL
MDKQRKEGVQSTIGHVRVIDGVRGIAVLLVVFFHYFALRVTVSRDVFIDAVNNHSWLSFIVGHGHLGVDIFFVLTGFLLVTPWLACKYANKQNPSIKKYFSRRLFRIMPAYYMHLIILFVIIVPWIKGTEIIISSYGMENLIHHVFFTHYFSPVTSSSFGVNGALWTLSLEAQFYIALPFIAYLLARNFWTTTILLVILSIGWRYVSYTQETVISDFYMGIGDRWNIPLEIIQNFIGTQLPGYLGHFSLGIMLSYLFINKKAHSQKLAGVFLLLSAASLYLILNSSLDMHLFSILIPFLLCGMLYYFIFFPRSTFSLLIANKFFCYTGKISYSMYLYHFPLILILNELLPDTNGSFIGISLFLLFLFSVSYVSYTYVEKPFMISR